MPTRTKLLLATMTAVILMSLAVSTASARRFFFSAMRYQAIWTLLKFGSAGITTMECPVTLEGSFHSASITKICGLLVGYITSAKINGTAAACLNTGVARVNTATLPWHIRYASFAGALPTITGITLQGIGGNFNIDPEGESVPNCNVTTTSAHPAVDIANVTAGEPGNRVIRTHRADETRTIPVGGSFLCEISAVEALFQGTAELFVQSSLTTRILVRLIQ